eukprot:13109676-Alexandrium_andersonii.AAC.1
MDVAKIFAGWPAFKALRIAGTRPNLPRRHRLDSPQLPRASVREVRQALRSVAGLAGRAPRALPKAKCA